MEKPIFHCPCSILIGGPSNSGKSVLTSKIIRYREKLFDVEFAEVIYYYNVWQPFFKTIKGVEFREGFPSHKEFKDNKSPVLVICDDGMAESKKSDMESFFTKYSHHLNVSIIFIVQNIFFKHLRT